MTYHLCSPVLFHESFKPGYSCISAICSYFSSSPSPIRDRELIIVGNPLHENVDEIENRFWVVFMSSVPRYVADNLVTLQFTMSCTVLNSVSQGECRLPVNIGCSLSSITLFPSLLNAYHDLLCAIAYTGGNASW